MKHKAIVDKLKEQVPAPWQYEARRYFQRGTTYTNEDGSPTTKQAIDEWVAGGDRRTALIRRII